MDGDNSLLVLPSQRRYLNYFHQCQQVSRHNGYRPKGVIPPKVFRAFLTHARRICDAVLMHLGMFLFPNKSRPIWRIFDAFLMHSSCCRQLFREYLLDNTDTQHVPSPHHLQSLSAVLQESFGPSRPETPKKSEEVSHGLKARDLSGHYSRDWSEYVNVIGVISEPFAREFS